MTVFLIVAAIMVLVAIGLLAPSLLGRKGRGVLDRSQQNVSIARERLKELEVERASGVLSEENYQHTRAELEEALRNDLEDIEDQKAVAAASGPASSRWTIATLAVAVPVLAGLIYAQLGMPEAFRSPQTLAAAGLPADHPPVSGSNQAASVEQMLVQLRARLEAEPNDAEGWFTLGSTLMSLDRYADAAQAFERTHQLVGDQPAVLLRYADALAMAQNGRISGKPFELIQTSLEIEPNNPMALWLAGLAYAEQGQFQTAIERWNTLLPLLEGDPNASAEVRNLIAQATQRLDGSAPVATALAPAETAAAEAPPAPAAPPPPTDPVSPSDGLVVSVSLDPGVAARTDPSDIVFVFATALEGPPMPLAVARHQVRDLPVQVTLNDTMAMMPAMKLSNFSEVRVGARISKTGTAVPQAGDLQGEVAPVAVGTAGTVSVVIDQAVP
jgi:cytochrome c-type biogenesis protein CcmH